MCVPLVQRTILIYFYWKVCQCTAQPLRCSAASLTLRYSAAATIRSSEDLLCERRLTEAEVGARPTSRLFFLPLLLITPRSSSSRSPARLWLCRLQIQTRGLRFISPFLVDSRQPRLVLPHSPGLRNGTSSWVRSPPTCRRLPPAAASPAPE